MKISSERPTNQDIVKPMTTEEAGELWETTKLYLDPSHPMPKMKLSGYTFFRKYQNRLWMK